MVGFPTVSDHAALILRKIHAKGWNAYRSTEIARLSFEETVRNELAEKLLVEERYVLLAGANNPRDPQQVDAAMETLALRLNRETPTILIENKQSPWTGFTLHSNYVQVHTYCGHDVSYLTFISALDSIIQISST